MAKLKVLMMGGRRCGKTSALASLFDQMIHGATNEFLTVCDLTKQEDKYNPITKHFEKQDLLSNKKLELEYFIDNGGNRTFLVDKGPTPHFWDYNLQIKIPGTSRSMEIIFRDSAGEFFDAGGPHHEETVEFVKECDVFVIVVDTTYLMAGTPAQSQAANIPDSIHTFLTQIDSDKGRKAKQVIFVPIKCEKWVQTGQIDSVVSAIEKMYDATIKDLSTSNKTEISIIPIQTVGDILFEELRKAHMLFNETTQKGIKCSKISDRLVILNTGISHQVTRTETILDDPEGVFIYGKDQKTIDRPSAWFHLPYDREAKYTPHNCEQLPLHIIRFMFQKKKLEAWNGIIGNIINFFGGISSQDMQTAIDALSRANLIKDYGEGIKIIRRCF